MAAPVQRAAGVDTVVYLQVRLPGWLKNEVLDRCAELDCSVNGWLIEAARAALREGRGLPEPPVARAPLVTPADEIRAYLRGERLMAPCGREITACSAQTADGCWSHDAMSFCRECGIRVT